MANEAMILPNFILIGAYKSGTTSMYHYLRGHPEIYLTEIKEMNFWAYEQDQIPQSIWGTPLTNNTDQFAIRSMDKYCSLFDGVRNEKAIGDISPMYMMSATAPQNIHQHIPDVKLIAILRNPVDRAYSAYLMHRRSGLENREPADFFEDLSDKREIHAGFYYSQLVRYFDIFDHANIKVYIFEVLKSNPMSIMQDIYQFLCVSKQYTPNFNVIHNVGGVPKHPQLHNLLASRNFWRFQRYFPRISMLFAPVLRKVRLMIKNQDLQNAPELHVDIRNRLQDVYYEDIIKLQELTGKKLSIWLS
jgi:hypothetical protein